MIELGLLILLPFSLGFPRKIKLFKGAKFLLKRTSIVSLG
jgi:hypothetical protein